MSERRVILKLRWPPKTANSGVRQFGRGRWYTSDEIKRYRELVRAEFLSSGQGMLGRVPVFIRYDMWPARREGRVDYDNIEKVVNDALTRAHVFADDSLIVKSLVYKYAAAPPGRLIVEATEFEGDLDAIGEARLREIAGYR